MYLTNYPNAMTFQSLMAHIIHIMDGHCLSSIAHHLPKATKFDVVLAI